MPFTRSSGRHARVPASRMRARGEQAGEPLGGQGRGGCRDHEVAEAASLEHLRVGEHRDLGEHRGDGRDLPAGEGESRAVGDVDEQYPSRGEQLRDLAVELDAGEVRRGLRAGVDVGDDEIARADEGGGELLHARARVPDAEADRRALR